MDKNALIKYLEAIDENLQENASLVVYGSAAFILLDEVDRTSLDIDVAAPYSEVDYGDLEKAAGKAGLSINPDESGREDHIEWISPARLCLAKPSPESEMLLWRGRRLSVKTVSPADLAASKLIRCDDIDRADIQFICQSMKIPVSDVRAAVERLPGQFKNDPLVRDNLKSLETDMELWGTKQ